MKREFHVKTPMGDLHIYAKHENILSISSAPVYDLLCLVENNASDGEDLSRAIRASRHIRNLFPDVEVIQKMRLSRQRTEQIVVDYLFENTDFR